jgi:serine protease Do
MSADPSRPCHAAPGFAGRALPVLALAALLLASPPAPAAGPDSFAPMIKRVLPAVVQIRVTETVAAQEDPLSFLPPELQQELRKRLQHPRRERMHGAGSGFVIDPAGYIVTNNHVVGKADQITVVLYDGTELNARLVGADELTDVALIKVAASAALPAVGWGDSRALEIGDWVIAAGNPFDLGGSVSAGIVSARGRVIGEGPFDDFIQIDAPINPGNSGGPVFNEQGQVVGIDTAIASPTGASVGIAFAIPSEIAQPIVAELRDHGRTERGWLGAAVADAGEAKPGSSGALIGEVERNSPALHAGLRPGDVVIAVNGRAVDDANALIRQIARASPESRVRLTVRRQGREIELSVTVGRRPNGQG